MTYPLLPCPKTNRTWVCDPYEECTASVAEKMKNNVYLDLAKMVVSHIAGSEPKLDGEATYLFLGCQDAACSIDNGEWRS